MNHGEDQSAGRTGPSGIVPCFFIEIIMVSDSGNFHELVPNKVYLTMNTQYVVYLFKIRLDHLLKLYY